MNVWVTPKGYTDPGTITPTVLGTQGRSYDAVGLALNESGTEAYFELVDKTGDTATIQACVITDRATCRTLASARPSAAGDDVAYDSGHLYWTEAVNGRIVRRKMSDSSISYVATGQSGPVLLDVYGGYLYWADRIGTAQYAIKRSAQPNLGPNDPQAVVMGTLAGSINALAAANNIYFAGLFGNQVKVGYAVAGDGGPAKMLATGVNSDAVPAGNLEAHSAIVFFYYPDDKTIRAMVDPR